MGVSSPGSINLIINNLGCLTSSASKGLQEKDFGFDLDFFAEVDPEVSALPSDLLASQAHNVVSIAIHKKTQLPVSQPSPPQKGEERRILASLDQGKGQECVPENGFQQMGG